MHGNLGKGDESRHGAEVARLYAIRSTKASILCSLGNLCVNLCVNVNVLKV